MSSYKLHGTFLIEDVHYEGKIYQLTGTFKGSGYYDPGRMYMPNGDPGYPPSSEEDWEDFEYETITCYDPETDSEVELDYDTLSDELKRVLDTATENELDECISRGDWEAESDIDYDWEPEEPEEPEDW